jgi:cysteine synthase A
MAKFANILETVGRTPVVRVNRIAPKNINLFVKIEAFNPLGSVKDRLALGVIEAAEKSGELKPGQTVIEATSGNTGIGLAMVCAAKGYPLVVTMAETFSIERRKLMRFLGAKVVLTPAAERGLGMVNKAIELAKTHGWFLTRQFENEANPAIRARPRGDRRRLQRRSGYWVTVRHRRNAEGRLVLRAPTRDHCLRPAAPISGSTQGAIPTVAFKPNAAFKPHRWAGPGFHSKITVTPVRHGRVQRITPHPGPDAGKWAANLPEGRGILVACRCDLVRSSGSLQGGGTGCVGGVYSVRDRRTISFNAAVCRCRCGHERRRTEDFEFDPEPPYAAESGCLSLFVVLPPDGTGDVGIVIRPCAHSQVRQGQDPEFVVRQRANIVLVLRGNRHIGAEDVVLIIGFPRCRCSDPGFESVGGRCSLRPRCAIQDAGSKYASSTP